MYSFSLRTRYLVIALALGAVSFIGCTKDDDVGLDADDRGDLVACAALPTQLEELNCSLGGTRWTVSSVISDIARTDENRPEIPASRDWSVFLAPCAEDVTLVFPSFGEANLVAQDTLLAIVKIEPNLEGCPRGDRFGIVVNDYMRTAVVAASDQYMGNMYGASLRYPDDLNDRWRDIEWNRDTLGYSVTRSLQGQTYDIRVSLERAP